MNAERFTAFLPDDLFPVLDGYAPGSIKAVVVDNAQFHHSEVVVSKFPHRGIQLGYLPPYSPQLNPIENLFGTIKTTLRHSKLKVTTVPALRARVQAIIADLQGSSLEAYFQEARLWMVRAQRREDFLG